MREFGAPSRGQGPILPFDVVHNGRAWPSQERGDHQTDALAGACWGHGQDVLGAVVPQIAALVHSKDYATAVVQARPGDIGIVRPAGRAVGGGLYPTVRPPGGSPERNEASGNSSKSRQGTGTRKDCGCLGVECQPPAE